MSVALLIVTAFLTGVIWGGVVLYGLLEPTEEDALATGAVDRSFHETGVAE